MNPKVEQWLKEQEEKQKEQEQIARDNLLIELGLCEKYNEPIEGGQYNDTYVAQSVKAFDVTDEEYEAILKYADTSTSTIDNAEEKLRTVAYTVLVLCTIGAIAQIIFGISCIAKIGDGIGIMILLSALVTIVSGFVIYWTTKVFTNISEKTTEIRDILKSQSKK